MYFLVAFIVLNQCVYTFAELCVLENMVTITHPICNIVSNCSDKETSRNKRSKSSYEKINLLQPGSPSLSQFQTVRSDDVSTIKTQIYKSIFIATKTQQFCNENYTYRSYDGSCNNLENPKWGCAYTEMIRFLPARYSDGNGKIATSVNGSDLPLPRFLSSSIFQDKDRPSKNETLALMQWGQLIAHDVGKSASSFNDPVDCCSSVHQKCYPIEVPPNDPFYSRFNVTCLSMARTRSIDKMINCSYVPYQIAAVSHVIDLSELYGSSLEVVSSLRQYDGGLLEVHTTSDGRTFPKLSDDPGYDCNVEFSNVTCFHSSDSRINQNIQLTCIQTALLREHNRIAKILSELNPKWDDEKLFQEARSILIAIYQHITYNEWLPLILGKKYMDDYNLTPLKKGYTKYKDNINPSTINIFMTAAYRVFHSQIQGKLSMYNASRCPFRTLNLSDWMHRPAIIMKDKNYDSLLRGLTIEAAQNVDEYFTSQVTEMMFHGDYPYGTDLESFDIQRGRDHGLPSYNQIRELCNLSKAINFSDLLEYMDEKVVDLLSQLYNSVDDIDLFVGGTVEKLVENTNVGPTFLCVIGEEFVRKKFGDRFWYEHEHQAASFTKVKLQEIRKSTFARILCDNGDNITTIQPNGFLSPSLPNNKPLPCSVIPFVDLSKWKD